MRLAAHGIGVELPRGWDARIFARPAESATRARLSAAAGARAAATLHAASFALPASDGDFGTGATATMPRGGVFVTLTEYLPGEGLEPGVGLFAPERPPHPLRPGMFSTHALLLARDGQAGCQRFFSAGGRPFCLYVVIGSPRPVEAELAEANRILGSLAIEPAR